MKVSSFTIRAIIVFVLLSSAAFAQSSISGLVQDQTGAVIPGAKVTITDVDTGVARSVVSDAGGRYSVPSLIPDHYEVTAEMTGFSAEVRRGIQLTIGSELEINMALRVGQASEKLEVTTEAPMVETLSGSVSGLVNDQQIRDLPLNARTLDQLISLESSTPTFRNGNHSAQSGVELTYISHGGRDQMNEFLLDGQQMIGAYQYGTEPGGALGYNEGVDAIREFQVLTSNPSAAFGKKAGAIVNMASRSGTNQIHGSAFEFLRNSDLDARNFYDHAIPPFRRNQFGGSMGGPIIKDRTFFFFSYEGLRQALGLSVVETVPNNLARQGFVPGTNGQLTNVGVNPAVAPFLTLFPLANGLDFGNGTAQAVFSPSQVSSQDFYLGRVDHRISDKDSIFVRYTASPASTHTISPTIYQGITTTSQNQMTTIQETRVISPTTVNTIRVGLSRPTTYTDHPTTAPPSNSSALDFIPGTPQPGQITFALTSTTVGAGGLTLGSITNSPGGTNPTTVAVTEWTLGEELVRQQGPHSLHFGFDAQPYIQDNQNNVSNRFGVMQFASLTTFLQAKPTSFAGPNPAEVLDGNKSYRQSYTDAYVQDDYKVRRNLTLNLGVRWEFMSPPWETYNRISNYHLQVINGLRVLNSLPTVGSPIYASHYNNVAPRVGFAWDVFGDGKMAIRGGFGMFFDQEEALYRAGVTANAPFAQVLQVANPPFPFGFSGNGTPALPSANADSTDLKVATRIQYNLSIERQIRNTVFKIGYVGSEAYHLTTKSDMNEIVPTIEPGNVYFFPSNGQRANPALASTVFWGGSATSSYQGLDLSASQRLSHGLQYKVNFTWSKNIDSASDTVSGLALGNTNVIMENNQLGWDRGLSAFNLARNFVGNVTYDLPWVNSKNATARWIGGWQIAAIVTVQDGFPFTALTGFNRSQSKANTTSDRPNLASGLTSVPIIGSPTEYFNPNVFTLPTAGFYGSLGRNTLIGPGLANVDFNVTKIFPIGERVKLNFRAEFYNALNRPNFALPGNQVFTSTGAVNPAAGVIQSTVTTSRQLQFGLKLVF